MAQMFLKETIKLYIKAKPVRDRIGKV